jgi:hypothetical protein
MDFKEIRVKIFSYRDDEGQKKEENRGKREKEREKLFSLFPEKS